MAAQPTTLDPAQGDSESEVFRQLEAYPWEKDAEYQIGLDAILGTGEMLPAQVRELTLRAQCYYFSRKNQLQVDFNGYKSYLDSRSSSAPEQSSPNPSQQPAGISRQRALSLTKQTQPAEQPEAPPSAPGAAPYPPTFAEIVALISSGKPVPGIREIPSTVLSDQKTESKMSKRRKPWEKDVPEDVIQGNGEGTFGDRRDKYIPQDLGEV